MKVRFLATAIALVIALLATEVSANPACTVSADVTVNIRNTPSGTIAGTLAPNKMMFPMGYSQGWFKVSLQDNFTYGWISAEEVDAVNCDSLISSAVQTAVPTPKPVWAQSVYPVIAIEGSSCVVRLSGTTFTVQIGVNSGAWLSFTVDSAIEIEQQGVLQVKIIEPYTTNVKWKFTLDVDKCEATW